MADIKPALVEVDAARAASRGEFADRSGTSPMAPVGQT
jgi:hypothetical protein